MNIRFSLIRRKRRPDLPGGLSYVGTVVVAPSSVDADGNFVKAVGTGYFKQDAFDENLRSFRVFRV